MAFADGLVSESLTGIYVSTWDSHRSQEVIFNEPQEGGVEKTATYCDGTISPIGKYRSSHGQATPPVIRASSLVPEKLKKSLRGNANATRLA